MDSEGIRNLQIRAWTLRLYNEYEQINTKYSLALSPLVIAIDQLGQMWGQYDSQKKAVRLNERLFREYTWETVVEILKHEMAHHYVHEKTKVPGTDHGREFAAICRRMAMPLWASRATGDLPGELPNWQHQKLADDQEKLLRKAEKLLALAASGSEHEAALAMERVRQLYTKYNLDQIASKHQEEYVYCVVTRKKRRIETLESHIFSILIEFFFVKVVTRTIYDHHDMLSYRGAEIIGKGENVKLAEYVYHFLWNQAAFRAKVHQKTNKSAGVRRAYQFGLIEGFAAKMREQTKSLRQNLRDEGYKATDVVAVLNQTDHQLDAFVNTRFPHLTDYRSAASRSVDPSAFRAGYSDGQNLTLHRGITHQKGGFGGYIK